MITYPSLHPFPLPNISLQSLLQEWLVILPYIKRKKKGVSSYIKKKKNKNKNKRIEIYFRCMSFERLGVFPLFDWMILIWLQLISLFYWTISKNVKGTLYGLYEDNPKKHI